MGDILDVLSRLTTYSSNCLFTGRYVFVFVFLHICSSLAVRRPQTLYDLFSRA